MSALTEELDNLDFYADDTKPFEKQVVVVLDMMGRLILQSYASHEQQMTHNLRFADAVQTLADAILKLQEMQAELGSCKETVRLLTKQSGHVA